MSASPKLRHPAAAQACSPSLLPATAKGAAHDDHDDYDDEHFRCRTPNGAEIIFLRQPDTCPPAPRKPPPPASRRRLFAAAAAAADMIALRFDDQDAIFCPAELSDGEQRRRGSNDTRTASSARRSVGAI